MAFGWKFAFISVETDSDFRACCSSSFFLQRRYRVSTFSLIVMAGKKAIVIGGGFGGLSASSYLASAGWDVTLLEKNSDVGGRARVWRKDGFVFDMGPSWYLMPEVFEQFFGDLGRSRKDYYELYQLDPYYRVFFGPGESVDIDRNLERTKATFDTFEPGGGEKLVRYLRQAEYKYNIAMSEFLYREYRSLFDFFNRRLMLEGTKLNVFQNLDRFVGRYFTDRRAKQILEYAMVFLGASPRNAPALYSIMSHVDLNLGVWFPRGGMASFVDGTRRLADELGVQVLTDHPVGRIVVEDGRAVAVEANGSTFDADLVLANADYPHVETTLLEERYQSYPAKYWKKRVMAPTMFIVYLGLNRKIPELVHHNLYFDPEWHNHFSAIFDKPAWPETFSYYVSSASYDDPDVAPEGHENVFFLLPVASGLEDTEEIRNHYYERLLDHLEGLIGTTIRESIVISRIFSHRDFAEDYNAYQGSALGIAHTLGQTAVFRPSQRSRKVKNLFYSGQYTHPGVGVPMTFISSKIITDSINRELL